MEKFPPNYEDSLLERKEVLDYSINKKQILINKILKCRINAIKCIIKHFRSFIKKLLVQKKFFLCKILQERIFYIQLIQTNIRIFLIKKKVKKILQKQKEYFSIISDLNNYSNLSLKVINKEKGVTLNFKYCKLRKVFVLYISRNLAQGSVYRVNFIADGKIIIDPMFRTDYDENGNFYNIIDFNLIEDEEDKRRAEKYRVVNYYRSEIAKQKKIEEDKMSDRHSYISSSSSWEGKESEDENSQVVKSGINYAKMKKLYFKRNSLNYETKERKLFSRSILNLGIKPNHTLTNLHSPLKPILKSPNFSRNSLGVKRVSFNSQVEFSY
jgi:hypothetical protein